MRINKVWWWGTAVSLFLIFIFTSLALAQDTPTRQPMPRPTVDRLSAPPTVASPTQADDGAQLYWLHCQPCHGDVGQGLTDEWRAEYPEDHQNCWKSGCHGDKPYEEGFTLPQTVPAIIGEGTLKRFQTLGDVYEYTRVKMPFEYPGVLSDEEYLSVTAFLAQENGLRDGVPLTEANAVQMRLRPGEAVPQATATPDAGFTFVPSSSIWPRLLWGSGAALIFLAGVVWLWYRRKQ
ncbi:MAG: cytochrome c [Ardenticatenaceae bacterium]|nr:cytochrome c [Ardenticatenaceae bacterium]